MMRQLRAEALKTLLTRSTLWLLIASWLIPSAASAVLVVASPAEAMQVSLIVMPLALASAFVVPILGILTMASDWQTREIVSVFLAEPHRGRVLGAKFLWSTCLGATSFALNVGSGLALASVGSWVRGLPLDWHGVTAGVQLLAVPALTGLFMGMALAAATQASSLAIALTLAQTLVIDPALGLLPRNLGSYAQSSAISSWLFEGGAPGPALSASVLWIAVPSLIGAVRFMRGDAA